MTLTEEEKKICSYYSQTFDDGKVGCSRCPLQVDRRWCVCKANCTEEEWEERIDNDTVN
jgi:hypothetical protein